MRRLIAAEFLKLRTTRTFYGFLIATVALTLLFTILTLAFLDADSATDAEIESLLTTGNVVGLLILVLGVIGMSGEHRHNTISSTLLAAPSRAQVIAAKALAYALAGLVLGLAAFLLTAVIVYPTLAALDVDAGPSSGRLVELLLGGLVYSAVSGALGVGVGAVVPNQVAAVLGAVLLLLAIDPLIIALAPEVGRYGVSASGFSLSGSADGDGDGTFSDGTEGLTQLVGGLVYLGWALAFLTAGAQFLQRREIV